MNGLYRRQKLDVHKWRNTVEWTVYKAEIRHAQCPVRGEAYKPYSQLLQTCRGNLRELWIHNG